VIVQVLRSEDLRTTRSNVGFAIGAQAVEGAESRLVREDQPNVHRVVAGVLPVGRDRLGLTGQQVRERKVQPVTAGAAGSRDLDRADRAGDRAALRIAEVRSRTAARDRNQGSHDDQHDDRADQLDP